MRGRLQSGQQSEIMKQDNGTFGLIVGGLVALAAVFFIFSGGELGGKTISQRRRGSAADRDRRPQLISHRPRSHHHAGGVNRPAACSITCAAENSVSSSNGPADQLQAERQALRVEPRRHRDAGQARHVHRHREHVVQIHLDRIGLPFSPSPKAADGVAGVSMACTPALKQSSKSCLISVRTFCARK